MMCHISKGDTPLEIWWEFNGKDLSQDDATFSKVGDRSSVLVLASVMGSHSGNYTCVAKNRARVTSYTTVLKVIGTYSSRAGRLNFLSNILILNSRPYS